jgi:hypothetical protein
LELLAVAKRIKRVFISYSSEDKLAAELICTALEGAGLRCYLAHRDNRGGMLWDEAILDALDSAAAVVLVLSGAANTSPYVKREIERAASRDIPIAPLRIEDVAPGRALEFFIKIHHWLNAFPPPLEQHLPMLVTSVEQLFQKKRPAARSESSVNVYPYMISRGPAAHQAFTQRPGEPWDTTIRGTETIENLRAKLLAAPLQLRNPVDIKVQGTLFPCALLSSGWWERRKESKIRRLQWRDGLQEWLFHGFDLWGPSWDFTWDFEQQDGAQKRPHFIAQIGDGDEANSIPVLLPADKARRLTERLGGTWGGVQADVSGVLGHRKHFEQYVDKKSLELFGGLLDYCLWLDADKKSHVISLRPERTEIYSGYLWKCVAPKELVVNNIPCLSDVFFLWEHVNFASKDALDYCLESLLRKEDHVQRRYGEIVLVQKSSGLVPGRPILGADAVYDMLLGNSGIEI